MSKQNADIRKFFQNSSKPSLNVAHSQPAPEPRPDSIHEEPSFRRTGGPDHSPSQVLTSPSPPAPALRSSRNSANTTKRAVSNGAVVVLDSDGDIDSDSDSVSDSLSSSIIQKPPIKPTATTGVVGLRPWEKADDKGLRQPPKRRDNGKSFKMLVQTAQRNAEIERQITKVKADLDKPLVEETSENNPTITEEMLASTVHDEDDPDKAKRLYQAMQRTNALRADCVFHFFDQNSDSHTPKCPPFPMNSLSKLQWASHFEGQDLRDQAFLSGFARQVFHVQQLPEELASWMIDEVCAGRSKALSSKYIQLLAASPHHLKSLLHEHKIDAIFGNLGADMLCLNPSQETVPSYEFHAANRRPLPGSLVWVCKLLQTAAPQLRNEAKSHALYVLFHLCMDDGVHSDIVVLQAVQDAIEELMSIISSNNELVSVLDNVLSPLLRRVKHPILQRNLVRALPAKSPLTAYFQRHLALSLILYPTKLDDPLSSPKVLELIYGHLESSPNFQITNKSDYVSLAARFTLLDIAIGPGPLSVPYQPLTSPPASQDEVSAIVAPGPSSSEEKAFNRHVDALAQQIRFIGNSINVSGALTDLARLDANDACDRLRTRLEHAVRIGGKKRKDIFSRYDEEDDWNKAIFKKFLDPTRASSGAQTPILEEEVNGVSGDD